MDRKVEVSGLAAGAIAIVVLIFIVVIGANLVTNVKQQASTACAGTGAWYNATPDVCLNTTGGTGGVGFSTSYNISNSGLGSLGVYSNWFSIIVLVVIAGVIIALLMRSFGGGMQ